jgi:periplasmic mercuric ion binding protein
MKRITLFLLLSVAAACFGGNRQDHGARQKQTRSSSAKSKMAMISLPTMQCNTCAETIQKSVEKVEGVKSASIDLKEKTAHVNFDPAKTSQEKIEKAIAAAGYDANQTKRDEKAHAALPACCRSPR